MRPNIGCLVTDLFRAEFLRPDSSYTVSVVNYRPKTLFAKNNFKGLFIWVSFQIWAETKGGEGPKVTSPIRTWPLRSNEVHIRLGVRDFHTYYLSQLKIILIFDWSRDEHSGPDPPLFAVHSFSPRNIGIEWRRKNGSYDRFSGTSFFVNYSKQGQTTCFSRNQKITKSCRLEPLDQGDSSNKKRTVNNNQRLLWLIKIWLV